MFDVDLGSNIDLDISLAHPWSSETYPSSAEKIGAATSPPRGGGGGGGGDDRLDTRA